MHSLFIQARTQKWAHSILLAFEKKASNMHKVEGKGERVFSLHDKSNTALKTALPSMIIISTWVSPGTTEGAQRNRTIEELYRRRDSLWTIFSIQKCLQNRRHYISSCAESRLKSSLGEWKIAFSCGLSAGESGEHPNKKKAIILIKRLRIIRRRRKHRLWVPKTYLRNTCNRTPARKQMRSIAACKAISVKEGQPETRKEEKRRQPAARHENTSEPQTKSSLFAPNRWLCAQSLWCAQPAKTSRMPLSNTPS